MKNQRKHSRNKKTTKTSQVRIIGGSHKRRFIEFADIDGLRPTPDRLRETLFNWLMPYLPNANVLDMCAGSGVLGLECLSRGANLLTLIEPNNIQYYVLKHSIHELDFATQTQLINSTAEKALPKIAKQLAENISEKIASPPFDIIFIDPPYSLNLWNTLLNQVLSLDLCHDDTVIYLEADKPHEQLEIDSNILEKLESIKQTKQGQIFAGLYQITTATTKNN